MKIKTTALLATVLSLGLITPFAQPMGGMGGPAGTKFGGGLARLFGEHKTFTATLEVEAKDARTGDSTLPGKLSFDDGKSRFEMDMAKMKNSMLPPEAMEQMQAMGMDRLVVISRPDKKTSYMIYPGLKAYAEMPLAESDTAEAVKNLKLETTELAKETIDGHPSVKNKVVVSDAKGKKQEYLVWNATDLKAFPVKIELTEGNTAVTMNFKDIKLTQPEAKQFDAPRDLKRYENVMALMQEEIMKRMGGFGAPPAR